MTKGERLINYLCTKHKDDDYMALAAYILSKIGTLSDEEFDKAIQERLS